MPIHGWIGFDLDGTLAHYDGWKHWNYIGKPIVPMIKLIKQIIEAGKYDVKIFTARVSNPESPKNLADIIHVIQNWTEHNIGKRLEVTCSKNFQMVHLYDDRATAVEFNTGRYVGYTEEESFL